MRGKGLRTTNSECMHHGYSEPQLINTCYRGVNLNYKTTLDTASEGNFNTISPEEERRLIENVASGNAFERIEIERGDTLESAEEMQLAQIKATLESFRSLLIGQNQFQSHKEDENVSPDLGKQLESIDTINSKDQQLGFNNGSFTQNYDVAIGERRGKEKSK